MHKRRPRPFERASFSVAEIAIRHGLSESFVYDEIRQGRLIARKPGGAGPLRVRVEDESSWISASI